MSDLKLIQYEQEVTDFLYLQFDWKLTMDIEKYSSLKRLWQTSEYFIMFPFPVRSVSETEFELVEPITEILLPVLRVLMDKNCLIATQTK